VANTQQKDDYVSNLLPIHEAGINAKTFFQNGIKYESYTSITHYTAETFLTAL